MLVIYGAKPLPLTKHLSSQERICWGTSIPETIHIHFLPGANGLGNSRNAPKLQTNEGGPSSRNLFPSLSRAVNCLPSITHHLKAQMWGEGQGECLPARQNAALTKNLGGWFEELIPTFPTSDSLSLDISWLIPL